MDTQPTKFKERFRSRFIGLAARGAGIRSILYSGKFNARASIARISAGTATAIP